MSASEDHPVVAGLAALAGVGLAVGLLLGLVTMIGTDMAGLGGEAASVDSSGQESLYVPEPTKTARPSGPLITLAPGETEEKSKKSKPKKSKKSKPDQGEISLQAAQDEVGSMDQIDLSGVYPGGEGAILQVQRRESGAWEDFPVTTSVANETFATYVQTGRSGKNVFRMSDSDSDTTSNRVKVTVK